MVTLSRAYHSFGRPVHDAPTLAALSQSSSYSRFSLGYSSAQDSEARERAEFFLLYSRAPNTALRADITFVTRRCYNFDQPDLDNYHVDAQH